MGLDWIGLDGWLSYTAVTPRASLKSDANNHYQLDNYFLAALLRFCSLSEASLALGGVIGTLC